MFKLAAIWCFVKFSSFLRAQLELTVFYISRQCNSDTWTSSLTNQTCGKPSGLNGLVVCSNASAASTNSCWPQINTLLPEIFTLWRYYQINSSPHFLHTTSSQSRLFLHSLPAFIGRGVLTSSRSACAVARFVERLQNFTHVIGSNTSM